MQRMGRDARYNEKEAKIVIIRTDGKPYPKDKVDLTWQWLEKYHSSFRPRIPPTYNTLIDKVHGKRRREIERGLRGNYRGLEIALYDPYSRSVHILKEVLDILSREPFLREYTLPLSVDDDFVLLSPYEVYKLFKRGLIEVNVEDRPFSVGKAEDAIELAKLHAKGAYIELTYKAEYDSERGIVV